MTTFLLFDEHAQEAAESYAPLLPDTRITLTSSCEEGGQLPAGGALVVGMELLGLKVAFLNAGAGAPAHSEALSIQVDCETRDNVDRVWDALVSNGGSESRCGWCSDRFGISWQVIPKRPASPLAQSDARMQPPQ